MGKLAGCIVELESGGASSAAAWLAGTLDVVAMFARARDAVEAPGRLGEEICAAGGDSRGIVVAKLPRFDAAPRARTASVALA